MNRSNEEAKEHEATDLKSLDFRIAQGCINGGGKREIKGKIVGFHQFPAELQAKMEKDVQSWVYKNV